MDSTYIELSKCMVHRIKCIHYANTVRNSAIALNAPSLAAAPAETPSQISMSIGGGAEEGKTAMSFNWVTDLSVDASEIVYRLHHLPWIMLEQKVRARIYSQKEDIIISRNEPVQFTPINSFNVVIQDLIPETKYSIKLVTLAKDIALSKVYQSL